ncbi:hypothetical protein EDB86DRAFT_928074 [Lactarius hatsudake]|nr:hypothetical protein EDB86DRAFT_928074 [Lactarius hatsudake]
MILHTAEIHSDVLLSVIEHIFLPPKLPQEAPTEEAECEINVALCHILIEAARTFSQGLPPLQRSLWARMIKMMGSIYRAARVPLVEAEVAGALSGLAMGDAFVMHIRAQNAAIIVRMLIDHVRFEIFEVSPPTSDILSTKGKLLCSYPGPAIQISSDIFSKKWFPRELASFLIQMDVDVLDSTATAVKAGSTVREVRESAHPRYISELLVGILRGFGQPAYVNRITKRIGDEVLLKDAYKPWRRSPLWLVIRVALQTSLDYESESDMYKTFLLFFRARLLQICVQRGFPSETLHLMRVKMARRLSKLGPAVSDDVYRAVYDIAKETETLLQNRWSSFRASQSVSPPWHPEELDYVRDTAITLKNSRRYLINTLCQTSHTYIQKQFKPSHPLRLVDTVDFIRLSRGRLIEAVAKDKRTALADFELSVERYLDSWVGSRLHDDDAPDVIASCVEQYYASAREIYNSNPEDNSVMVLTIMDLWMALDKLTTHQCPLLTSYSPEIPGDFLHPLLLHRSGSMRRAMLIEEHILQRHQGASCATSIFSDTATESSFAVQYFNDSPELQQLYLDIDQHAEQQQEEKCAELDVLNERWRSLKDAASMMDHDYILDHEGNIVHGSCEKCRTNSVANKLKIDIFEWPLPEAMTEAPLVIFELDPPRAFSAWREITYKILCDIGMPNGSDDADQPKLLLDAFSGLRDWAVRHEYHRITIGSTTKSFGDQTHYRKVKIPADVSDVLLNNGLTFKLYDRKTESWAARPFQSTIANLCTPPIPVSSPYGKLHSFVCGTRHTSNEVIAGQADCPPELSAHEYLAFSGLRSGPRLQWLNIARELSSPSLSFRREEVHTLITQAAWNLGPLTDGVREWHTDLGNPSFGWTLLHELDGLLGRIEANWLEEVTVRTIALITSRLLSSTGDPDIRQRAYDLLQRARSVAHKWINEIGSKLDTTEDETSRTNLRRRLCTLAATCFSTYDVCLEHIPQMLASDDDIAIAVHCAVIVHDNTLSNFEDKRSRYLIRLLNRHHRLLHFLEPFLRQGVQSNPSGFDHGFVNLWPGFRRQTSSNWHVLPSPNSRWISCIIEGGQEVHYNLLTGNLLIGGKPLGRLPQEIIEHSTYTGILGTRVLDVVPADIPEMEFMTRSNVFGYQILFSLRGGNLILQARKPTKRPMVQKKNKRARRLARRPESCPPNLQLVPREVFDGDFPKAFVVDYVHWLDLRTGEVEFRPVEFSWTPDPSNWRLTVHTDNTRRSLFRKIPGDGAPPIDLIDTHSATFRMISNLFHALESPEHIIITRTNRAVEASLSRLHLVFFVNHGSELECRSMPGYVIDKFQSSGTMFGLRNRLILRPSNGPSDMPRRVIIPQGDIEFSSDGDFASVSIKMGSARHVQWHEYAIDTDLGRLTGNVSLRSKLFQCYLHAITSHCLPDPLLGHTGTEESLNMLQSAAFLSFQRLGKNDARLLRLIGDLTPSRVYYPPHLQSMVTVEWNDLPVLSQHHDFHPAVLSIIDHARAMEAFYDEPVNFNIRPRDASLLSRAASRNRVYYPNDLQSSRYSSASIPEDVAYKSRDVVDGGSAELTAYQTSQSVWNGRLCLSRTWYELWGAMQSWESLGTAEMKISLRYSRYWLTFDAAKDWLSIYDICQEALNCDSEDSKIKLAFSLSAASFSGADHADIIPLIQILATDTRLRGLKRPSPPYYDLSDGTYPDPARLVNLVSQFALPLELTPAQTMETQETTHNQVVKERRREYNNSVSELMSEAVQSIIERWPEIWCDVSDDWFDTLGCQESVDAYLHSITRNINLRDHIHRIQAFIGPLQDHHNSPQHSVLVFPSGSVRDHPKLISLSPSLREVLMSRASFAQSPIHGQTDSPLPSTSSDWGRE